jgi:SP family galactose:H+ symporter-like MFS transporter
LLSTVGEANTFMVYAVLNVIFALVVFFYVPETRGVSLEQLDSDLMAGKRLRDLGNGR